MAGVMFSVQIIKTHPICAVLFLCMRRAAGYTGKHNIQLWKDGEVMKLLPEKLSAEAFWKLGEFVDLLGLAERYEGKPTQDGFYPDVLQLDNAGKAASFSITKAGEVPRVIKTAECHSQSCEGILPLDGDVYIYTAPPYWYDRLNETRLFLVPRGTLVRLKPGVIHGAPIPAGQEPVNVLIVLPERTYANDNTFMNLEEKDWMEPQI